MTAHWRVWPVRKVWFECARCGRQTSVTSGTIFQDTRKPLRLWFRAIWHVKKPGTVPSAVRGRDVLSMTYGRRGGLSQGFFTDPRVRGSDSSVARVCASRKLSLER